MVERRVGAGLEPDDLVEVLDAIAPVGPKLALVVDEADVLAVGSGDRDGDDRASVNDGNGLNRQEASLRSARWRELRPFEYAQRTEGNRADTK